MTGDEVKKWFPFTDAIPYADEDPQDSSILGRLFKIVYTAKDSLSYLGTADEITEAVRTIYIARLSIKQNAGWGYINGKYTKQSFDQLPCRALAKRIRECSRASGKISFNLPPENLITILALVLAWRSLERIRDGVYDEKDPFIIEETIIASNLLRSIEYEAYLSESYGHNAELWGALSGAESQKDAWRSKAQTQENALADGRSQEQGDADKRHAKWQADADEIWENFPSYSVLRVSKELNKKYKKAINEAMEADAEKIRKKFPSYSAARVASMLAKMYSKKAVNQDMEDYDRKDPPTAETIRKIIKKK